MNFRHYILPVYILIISCNMHNGTKTNNIKNGFEQVSDTFQTKFGKEFKEYLRFDGDINEDGVTDKIIIYERLCNKKDESLLENARCRRAAIFLKLNGNYILYGYNDNLVDCSLCGGGGTGDPFQDIKIKTGYVSFESLYGACDKTLIVTTFHFNSKTHEIELYKIGQEDYSCKSELNDSGEIISTTKIKTKKDFGNISFKTFK